MDRTGRHSSRLLFGSTGTPQSRACADRRAAGCDQAAEGGKIRVELVRREQPDTSQ